MNDTDRRAGSLWRMRIALIWAASLSPWGCILVQGQCPGITPSFTWVSVNGAVQFSDVTETYGLPVTERWWEFGDGYYGSANDTAITYMTTGVDSVRLHLWVEGCEYIGTARVAHGDSNDICMAPIEPGFHWEQPANNQVAFANTTTATGVSLVSVWDFGDYQLGFDPAPTHAYLYPGKYIASLSMAGTDTSTGNGCVAGMMQRVQVDGNASTCDTSLFLDFSYVFDGASAQFTSIITTFTSDLAITWSEWDMGDGAIISSQPSPSHQFAPQGSHQVCLTVWAFDSADSATCSAMVCHTLEVNAVSIAEVERSDQLQAWPVPFESDLTVRGDLQGVVRFTLIDASGRAVDERNVLMNKEAVLGYSALSPGPYLLRASTSTQSVWCRVIKQ